MKTRQMFDFVRTILEKVSFDPTLFYKELDKAVQQLLPYDVERLSTWVNSYVKQKPELVDSLNLIDI